MTSPSLRARLLTTGVAAVVALVPLFVSTSAHAVVSSRLRTAWTDTSVTVGRVVAVRGTVRPARAARTVVLQRRTTHGWVGVASRRTREGAYRLRVPTARRGEFRYRVRAPRTRIATAATSRARVVRVRRSAARGNPRAFSFIGRYGTAVARWNPCRPIGYRVNARLGGRGALADVKEAVARIRRANGLRFVYRGATRIIPGGANDGRYPADTDLVISWARPSQSRHLGGARVAGVGGPSWVQWTQDGRPKAMITRGYAVLNANLRLGGGFAGGVHNGYYGTRGQLLMHEIGHAVGLDHPRLNDPWQVMYPTMTGKRAVWGAGDLRGLGRLGAAAGCLNPPSARATSTVSATWTAKRR